ncbi:uncharacterized protein LOC131015224 isoform X2 [Salvia miltiorrhiza]|uniref:uncharacterized protein LOC131015224 isoform X2 n=1 Tax=Salvia miltiorrhiza TaxID=226208 RepID=UPI0025AC2F37|nr:uncharacterized protein LOC131015224 isoform X2 [Salvia miltiorrhiza]XP_057799499.1 uncharacterized protein LOC131015224 isoform X2 [Salvia miltiorrhiza]
MDIVVMEETAGNSDFSDPTSKLGSFVQINSIAIDISSSMEAIEPLEHEHFSIRGFVAGMRKKDWKTCFPFAPQGNDVDPVNYLPPLFVPEFRWWQCSSCIPKDEMKRTTKGMAITTKCKANTSSCENVGAKDGLSIHRRDNTGSKGKTDIRDIEAGNSCDMPEVDPLQVIEGLNNTPDATDMVCLADHPSCVVVEPDNVSSGSDGPLSVLPHKRKPKLRSLADILVEERNQTSSIPRTRSALSCGVYVASTEMEAVLVPQLQVDVSAGVAEAARSPERKRKIAIGEDREPLVATFPRAVAKRTKGIVLDAEKKSRRVEISDAVTKGGASMRLDLQRTERIKPKKLKAIDTNKNMRHIGRDNEIVQMGKYLQPNAVSSANLQEQVVPVETNLGKLGGAPSILVEMGQHFRRSLSGQQTQKISDLSMAKMPEVGADDDPLLPPRKSILGDCNIRGTMALDLSLSSFKDAEGNHNDQASFREHRCIPDLNVESPEKAAMEGQQQSTIHSEERSFPLRKSSDNSASCSYETVREGKRISEPRNKDNIAELGSSDDIPIEIVELLAKNQHERELGISRRHLLGINDTAKGYSSVGVVDGTTSFPFPRRINGLKVANGNMGIQPNLNKPEKSHFRLSSSSTPIQLRKPEYSTPASIMAGPNSITWEEMLYSRATENAPFRLSIPQKHPIQPSPYSFLDECHKERAVDGKGKKAVADAAELKKGRIIGSSDPYQNDTIPAMQLLSLMDQRVKSGSSYKVGSLDKPLSSCKHHPRLNGKENHNFLRGSSFLPQNGSSLLRYGVYSSGESSFRASAPNLRVPQEVRNWKTTLLDGSNELDQRRAARSNAALGECTLNRNPADFSIPQVGNEFTISAKDLRPRKKTDGLKEKSRLGNVDGRKRPRMRKNASQKE